MLLGLEPVSKYRKEQHLQSKKLGQSKCRNITIQAPKGYTLKYVEYSLTAEVVPEYSTRQFEDSHLTRFLFEKLMIFKLNMNTLGVISIILSLFGDFLVAQRKYLLIFHSIISFTLVVLVFLKYFYNYYLKVKQLIRQKQQNRVLKCLKDTLPYILILLIHPNLLCEGQSVQMPYPIYSNTSTLSINTLLYIFMLGRIYLLYATIIRSSIYYTTRASRICRIYNTKNEDIFCFKSVFSANPLSTLVAFFVTLVVIYAQMLMLSEETNPAFNHFSNALWCIVITMGTIGYGDYYPMTYLGRIVAFAAAISGIIMASLLILTLSKNLAMTTRYNKAHITLRRLELRKLLERYSEETIVQTLNMNVGISKSSDKAIEQLKKKTESVKLTMRRIKNMIDTNSINEYINRLFYTLNECIMEIFLYQVSYSQLLVELYEKEKDAIQETKFSFTTEIYNIIKDR